jgi:uracil-DNA glycosylase
VHASGIPWDDVSGNTLREWLGIDRDTFYDPEQVALVPMGFCYPGTGKSGDLPPRPECAPLWHEALLQHLPKERLTLLIGQYAQARYLGERAHSNLTETVLHYPEYAPKFIPLPHPSPRNRPWLSKNPWFAAELLPVLRRQVQSLVRRDIIQA